MNDTMLTIVLTAIAAITITGWMIHYLIGD